MRPKNAFYTDPGTPDSADGTIIDANDCPWAYNDGYGRTSTNTCAPLCNASFTALRTSTGLSIPVFAKKNTSPSIHVRDNSNGTVCYIDLVLGSKPNAINVKYNNQTHHTTNQTTLTHEHNNMFLLLFLQH